MFRKVLIANRGEIALRVLRTCRAMGIKAVAVYGDGEENALHASLADEAYGLGPAPAGFLNAGLLLQLAKRSGCQAIHPGYGFLSEQASFAKACDKAGIAFVGPSARTLQAAGQKTQAREIMRKAGVPVLPGTETLLKDADAAKKAARRVGYPVLLKAAFGGGGKGMRVVHSARALQEGFDLLQQESLRGFGRGGLFLERFVPKARHIEVQILADRHGNILHLGERNCSLQRRHQKLLEESPSPALAAKTRQTLWDFALRAAKATRYHNAGTVEFLVDAENRVWFLEINARIQVEHAVTEAITGIDIVAEQLRVAAGERLALRQQDIRFSGHAIECRVYAEDPHNGFLPCAGLLDYWHMPGGPGIRVDSALLSGARVSTDYDALLAKVIAHGPDRPSAIARMRAALAECRISPLRTTLPVFHKILQDKAFLRGTIHTDHLQRMDWTSVRPAAGQNAMLLKQALQEGSIAAAGDAPATAESLPAIAPERAVLFNPWTA